MNFNDKMIPFNIPYISNNEMLYIEKVIHQNKLSGNGYFVNQCVNFFQEKYHFSSCYLTTSCTDALEMCALLLNISSGDEIIVPSYTFVSTANAFALRGAKIVFADSKPNHPNVDEQQLEKLITAKTKAIVVVYYGGTACNMNAVLALAKRYNLFVIEDAAQALDAKYICGDKNAYLGTQGHLAAFSFHETKNITCGEGGLLVVNEEKLKQRASFLYQHGTNKSDFQKGLVKEYEWVDLGSSFLLSEINAAFLYAQLMQIDVVQKYRLELWDYYYSKLKQLSEQYLFHLPVLPEYATNNAHIFYLILDSQQKRNELKDFLYSKNIQAATHYKALHQSKFSKENFNNVALPNAEKYADCLLRLPLYYSLSFNEIDYIVDAIKDYFTQP